MKLHSIIDIITNSSSELFCLPTFDDQHDIQELLNLISPGTIVHIIDNPAFREFIETGIATDPYFWEDLPSEAQYSYEHDKVLDTFAYIKYSLWDIPSPYIVQCVLSDGRTLDITELLENVVTPIEVTNEC